MEIAQMDIRDNFCSNPHCRGHESPNGPGCFGRLRLCRVVLRTACFPTREQLIIRTGWGQDELTRYLHQVEQGIKMNPEEVGKTIHWRVHPSTEGEMEWEEQPPPQMQVIPTQAQLVFAPPPSHRPPAYQQPTPPSRLMEYPVRRRDTAHRLHQLLTRRRANGASASGEGTSSTRPQIQDSDDVDDLSSGVSRVNLK